MIIEDSLKKIKLVYFCISEKKAYKVISYMKPLRL